MAFWDRVKAVGDLWMNDPRLAAAGRAQAQFGAVLVTVPGVVALVVQEWGLAVVCLVAAVLLVLVARAAGQAARKP